MLIQLPLEVVLLLLGEDLLDTLGFLQLLGAVLVDDRPFFLLRKTVGLALVVHS